VLTEQIPLSPNDPLAILLSVLAALGLVIARRKKPAFHYFIERGA
jgi:hypothetical protein